MEQFVICRQRICMFNFTRVKNMGFGPKNYTIQCGNSHNDVKYLHNWYEYPNFSPSMYQGLRCVFLQTLLHLYKKKKKKEIVFTLGDGYNIISPEHWRSRALREEKTVFYSFYTTNVQNASTYIWVTILQNNKKQRRKKADMNGNKIYTSLTQ